MSERAGAPRGARFADLTRRPGERWGGFASRVASAFGLVLLLIIATYVLASLVDYRGWTGAMVAGLSATTSVVGLVSAGARPRGVRLAVAIAGVAIALAVLAAVADEPVLLGWSGALQALLFMAASGAILNAVLHEPEVGFRTILGAISVYMILGLLFTFLYAAIDRFQAGPFFAGTSGSSQNDYLFFSFTTLTTTGYGNLVPAAQPGQMFAGLEMLMGQIFLVTLIAGLVSAWSPGERWRRHG